MDAPRTFRGFDGIWDIQSGYSDRDLAFFVDQEVNIKKLLTLEQALEKCIVAESRRAAVRAEYFRMHTPPD